MASWLQSSQALLATSNNPNIIELLETKIEVQVHFKKKIKMGEFGN
jgi:hypothetical protein